jgi:hypothetical protein
MVAEPGRHLEFRHQPHQRLGFVDIRNSLQRQHIGCGFGKDLQPGPVPRRQGRDGQPVTSAVFRPVGERGAVRTNRGCHPSGIAVAGRGGTRQLDTAPQQPGRLDAADSARGEPVEGRLVAGRGGDHRSGGKESSVYGLDVPGSVDEKSRRPQDIGNVVPTRLEFSGQAAIADQHGIVGHGERHNATVGALGFRASRSDNGATRRRVPPGSQRVQALCSGADRRKHSRIPTTRFGLIGRVVQEQAGSVGS